MRLTFIAALFIIVCAGCVNNNKVPKGILSKDEMRGLVWDLMQVDTYAQTYIAKDTLKNLKKERTILFQQVFDLHKVSRDEFEKSFDYYMGRPDLTQSIFDTLASRQAQQRQEEARRHQDSIRQKELRRASFVRDSIRKDTSRIGKTKLHK
jgi:hypothetical protein